MKQTGQFKIIKNGSSVNFEHQVTFIFTRQDKTKFTRSTNATGAWDFDVPNGEYFISAFVTNSTEKQTEQFRGGLLFVVNAQTKVTALDDWINGGAIDAKDPMREWWENLLNETQQNAMTVENIKNDLENKGYYSPANTRKDKNNVLHATTSTPRDTLLVGDFGSVGSRSADYGTTIGRDFDKIEIINREFTLSGGWANNPHGTVSRNYTGVAKIITRVFNAGVVARLDFYEANNHWYRYFNGTGWSNWFTAYGSSNTTVDSNGFIKKASPIIKLFNDHIEHNDQFKEDPIFEKLDVGTYKISNTLGLAKEGWTYEKPRGADGNPYFRIVVEKLDDGCVITVHDEYESFEKAEIIDAEGNKRVINKVVKILGQKRDIQEHERWIDLRFHEQIYSLTNELPEINVPYRELWGIEPYIPPIVEPIEEDIALEDQRAF